MRKQRQVARRGRLLRCLIVVVKTLGSKLFGDNLLKSSTIDNSMGVVFLFGIGMASYLRWDSRIRCYQCSALLITVVDTDDLSSSGLLDQ